MSRNARLQTLVLCIVCLILIPVVVAAQAPSQTTGHPGPLPPEMMPGDCRTDADGRIFPPSLLPYLPDGLTVPQWTAAEPGTPSSPGSDRNPFEPGYSPEGNWGRIVMQSYISHNRQYELMVVRGMATGLNAARLTNSAANEAQPALSPNGKRIAFVSDADGDFDIYIASYDYVTETIGAPVKLTHNGYDDYWPVWSHDGARLAFHAIRSDNRADIFVMRADGSGLANLTNYDGVDLYPTWSPDGSKIAFSSGRSGGFRIHVMNADGSGVRQLSNLPYSTRPAWSPDGRRIAYTADFTNNGWLDVVLMNADGSSQRLLYTANSDFTPEDLEVRDWSHDGEFVTFTRVRYVDYNNEWYIEAAEPMYVGPDNATYGEVFIVPFSFEPHWRSIDLQPPQTAVVALPPESPYRFTVRWDGRDVGPAGLDLFDVQMQTDGGPWVDLMMATTRTEAEMEGTGGQRFAFRSRGRDYAGNLEAWPATPDTVTVIETDPPVSSIAPLPPFSRMGDPVYVLTDSQDIGGSGIMGIESHFRRNGGAWQDWLNETAMGEFSPVAHGVQAGDRIEFRVRATDYAGNVEEWPAGPGQANTVFYSRTFSGRVIDNTGNPVGGATAAATPAMLEAVDSAADGRFTAYMGVPAPSLTLQWAKPGYGALPSIMRTMVRDRGAEIVMPPADDVMDDGGFEDGDWGAWQPGGSITPTLLSDAETSHTGTTAAALGARSGPTGDPSLVTNTAQTIEYMPKVAVDSDGNPVLAWLDGESGALYGAIRRDDGTWAAVKLAEREAWDYDLVRSSDGLLYLVMRSDAVFVWRQSGEGWTAVGQVPGSANAGRFEVAPGPGGRLDVVFSDPESRILHTRRANGVWSARTQLQSPTGLMWFDFSTTVTPDGSFHVIWAEGNMTESFLVHRRLAPDGTWGPITTPEHSAHSHFALTADPDGGVHLGWRTTAQVWFTGVYYRSWANDMWGPAELLGYRNIHFDAPMIWEASADGAIQTLVQESLGGTTFIRRESSGTALVEPLPLEYGHIPTMVIDDVGGAHLVFAMPDANGVASIYYVTRSPSGDWSEPARISQPGENSERPWLDVTPNRSPTFVWENRPNPDEHLRDVGFAEPRLASVGGDSTLSQVVTIPAEMAHPALSFVYQSGGALQLEVESTSGERATTWSGELPSSPAGMRHSWLDLSEFSGQEVWITFGSEQTAGAPVTWAIIDDVSLGAAHTDIGVWGESSGRQAGDTFVHTVRVSNYSALAAGGVELTYTLPPELSFVSAVPAPSSLSPLRWQLGSLAGGAETTIRITVAVTTASPPDSISSTASVTTADSELELMNNSTEIVTLLEQWTLLPVILRP